MHIPDGFLDTRIWVGAGVLSAGAVAAAVAKTRKVLEDRQVPALGVMAAFVFAAQMVNFPVAGGTSGHLLGGALAAILLGPWSAGLILTTVLIIQMLFFYDGGLTALGANVLNMAVIAPWVAYGTYRLVSNLFRSSAGRTAAIFLASWMSVMAAALAASLEIAFSGTVPLKIVLPAMLGWHALIGIGEGLITVVVVSFVSRLWGLEQPEQKSVAGGEGL
ncbi:energy-coupling factor ABC transporter permease [Desulfofundulus thermocisternus]|uniref:energy-coupling factor ABC transporter permease n=1 Tax=Desulfofundulus thermocisternus TaxID=42471 RepID=UPI0019E43AE4|nr:energy-coupling factor ABC transporter permease [Desulfofundulus thermocisternus]MBE3586661.1 energy-coupling factor ABC transporter permease [Thermoanaerobacter sp.]MCS5694521.1 energy-coupling factor ABC transporter permease [Desulfofundulus thermocisternus]